MLVSLPVSPPELAQRCARSLYRLTTQLCTRGANPKVLIAELREAFERLHQQMYGYTAPEEAIQITTFRIEAIA